MNNEFIAQLGAMFPKLPNFAAQKNSLQPNFVSNAVEQLQITIAAATQSIMNNPSIASLNARKPNNTKGPVQSYVDDLRVLASTSLFLQRDSEEHPHHHSPTSTITKNNKRNKKQYASSTTHFPCLLSGSQHQLLATGKKIWGAGFFLPLAEIYSFAVYANTIQASKALHEADTYSSNNNTDDNNEIEKKMRRHYVASRKIDHPMLETLKSSPQVDLSLVVQISRNLPLGMMTAEYERILKRRLKAAGADPNDPALTSVITAFRKSLPERLLTKRGGFLKKGTTLVFTKEGGVGRLTATAGGEVLESVESRELCSAVFDLYIGSNPVSKKAVVQAVESLESLKVEKDGFTSRELGCRL